MLPGSVLALTASQVYEQVKDSVVVVKSYDHRGRQVGQGSGVMLPSNEIITNYHVVKAGVRYLVGQSKQGVSATLKAGDPDKDLCLLAAPGLVAEPALIGKSARLKVGDPVYAVGAPQGLELTLSEGIVSQLRGGPPPLIQTTVAISPGSSGGGLFNANGELVGITTFQLKESQNLNFAVPVEWIAGVARSKIPEVARPQIHEQGACKITEILLSDIADARGVVARHQDKFAPTTAAIKGTALISGMEKGQKVTADLIYGPENLKALSGTYDIPGSGDITLKFAFSKPTNNWPPGDYKVVVTTSDGVTKSVPFQVK
jgi:S1-C subfamily serine protease